MLLNQPLFSCPETQNYFTGHFIRSDHTIGAGNAYPSGAPDFTSGFHRSSCCPVICVSFFHVIALSFGLWVLNVPFIWLLGIYIFFYCINFVNLILGFQAENPLNN